MDRFLSRWLSWLLFAASLVAYGAISAFYFTFCWLVTGFIDRRLLRKEREETYAREGLAEDEIDVRLLPRDRAMTLLRAGFAFSVASAFHFFA